MHNRTDLFPAIYLDLRLSFNLTSNRRHVLKHLPTVPIDRIDRPGPEEVSRPRLQLGLSGIDQRQDQFQRIPFGGLEAQQSLPRLGVIKLRRSGAAADCGLRQCPQSLRPDR